MEQLKNRLENSPNPAIKNLDAATRNSLLEHIVFDNGRIVGLNGTDANITNLFNSNGQKVFSAIIGGQVSLVTFDTKLIVEDISLGEFTKLTKGVFASRYSLCTNCFAPSNTYRCCNVGGDGCIDEIFVFNGRYFHVQ